MPLLTIIGLMFLQCFFLGALVKRTRPKKEVKQVTATHPDFLDILKKEIPFPINEFLQENINDLNPDETLKTLLAIQSCLNNSITQYGKLNK